MRVLLQKVTEASVEVDHEIIGSIGRGYLLFLGVMEGDSEREATWMAEKIVKLRLFEGEDGKINDRTIKDIGGEILVVSQFTLAGDLSNSNRPAYTAAAGPKEASLLYEFFIEMLRKSGILKIETGRFGAAMSVKLTNDGPVTLFIDRQAGSQ